MNGNKFYKYKVIIKVGGPGLVWFSRVRVFTWFNSGLVTTQNVLITGVPQIKESISGDWETSKLGGIGLNRLFRVGVFTWFNCAFVTTQDISINLVPQIG
jgi:hypothetical protein